MPAPRLPYATIAVLLAAYVFSIFFRGFLTVVASSLERDLGLGPADLGAVGGAWFIAFALAQFPVGYALDHHGPRRTVTVCMVAGIAGLVLFAQASGFWSALTGMALMGLGCAPIFMGSLFIFAKAVPPERFGMVVSLFIGFGSAGNLLGATPLALAVQSFGWRGAMLAIAAAFAATTLLVALVVCDLPRDPGAGQQEGLWQGLASIMAIRPLWIIMPLVCTGYAVLVTERGLWIGPFFGQVHGFDVLMQGQAAFVMAVAMTIGALLFGPFERLMGGPKPAVALATAIVALAFSALALGPAAQAGGAMQAYLWLGVIGAAGFSYGSLMAHARFFMPEHLIGRGMTFVNFGFIAGSAAIQFLSGRFIQSARDRGMAPAEAFSGLHLAFAAVLALALVIYLFAPRRPAA
jgi:predicted MFS family arabinose efflux permease